MAKRPITAAETVLLLQLGMVDIVADGVHHYGVMACLHDVCFLVSSLNCPAGLASCLAILCGVQLQFEVLPEPVRPQAASLDHGHQQRQYTTGDGVCR